MDKGLVIIRDDKVVISEDGWAALMCMISILGASAHPNVAPAAKQFLQTLQMAVNDFQARSN